MGTTAAGKSADVWDAVIADAQVGFDGKSVGDLQENANASGAPAQPVAPIPDAPAPSEATAPVAPSAGEPKGEELPPQEGELNPAAPEPVDPLAGSEPFKYKAMDGSEKALEGVYRFAGEGLMIPEEKVADFERIVTEREQAVTLVTAAAERIRQLDTLGAWQITGDDGQPKTLTGREGLEAMRVSHARLEATLNTLVEALQSDPASLIEVSPDNKIVLGRDAIQNLMTRAELNEMRAEQQIRAALGRVLTASAPAPDTTGDYARHAPALIGQALQGSGVDASVLTPDDVQELTAVLPRFVRDTTPAERAANPAQTQIVDALYGQMVKNRATLRAQTTQSAQKAEHAGKVNASVTQMRQPQRAATPPAAPAAPQTQTTKPKSWDAQSTDLIESALRDLGL